MIQTLDQQIDEQIRKVDRLERLTSDLRKRGIKPDSQITTAYQELAKAKVRLANLQLKQINKLTSN